MQRVRGVGGVFIRSRGDQSALLEWYREHLGVDIDTNWGGTVMPRQEVGVTWSVFKEDTGYFGASTNAFMVNYIVDDLDAMLAQLREAGVEVDDHIEDSEYGRFGWCTDPQGNRVELWQCPPEPPGGA